VTSSKSLEPELRNLSSSVPSSGNWKFHHPGTEELRQFQCTAYERGDTKTSRPEKWLLSISSQQLTQIIVKYYKSGLRQLLRDSLPSNRIVYGSHKHY